MKALIVDDEPEIRQALAAIMEQEGCESVDMASSGEDALRLALQAKYDLVTLDIRLPDVSGVDILPTIHSIFPHSIIVILSAYIEGISEVHRDARGSDPPLTVQDGENFQTRITCQGDRRETGTYPGSRRAGWGTAANRVCGNCARDRWVG